MNVGVFGTGYVGLIAGICFSQAGHIVNCFDVDLEKINLLSKGICPIYEPGAEELLTKNIKEKRLFFNSSPEKVVKDSDIIFIAVGTPQDKTGKANLTYIESAAKIIGENITSYKVIVNKSTVPVGTADFVKTIIQKELKNRDINIEFDVVSNPEFLAEGTAINDFEKERVVIGADSNKAKNMVKELYLSTNKDKNVFCTDIKSAEIIKYANNCMLALRLSFINEVSQLCEKVGANVDDVSYGIGLDDRIGNKFLKASLGYGGSCFPKDIRAFISTMKENDCEPKLIDGIEKVNEKQLENSFKKIKTLLPNINGETISVLGVAFKANTDDVRESPSIELIKKIILEGGKVRVYDPKANINAKKVLPTVEFFDDAYIAIKGSKLLVFATDWKEFETLDFEKIKELIISPKIFDGRNMFNPNTMKEKGFEYLSIGRN